MQAQDKENVEPLGWWTNTVLWLHEDAKEQAPNNSFAWEKRAGHWKSVISFIHEGKRFAFVALAGEAFGCSPQEMLENPQQYSQVELAIIDSEGKEIDHFWIKMILGHKYISITPSIWMERVSTRDIRLAIAVWDK